MSSFEWNKIFGAVLGSILIVTAIGHIGNELLHEPDSEKRGYQIEVVEADENTQQGDEKIVETVLPLLATANINDGMKVFKKCVACHTVEKEGVHKVGPNLWNIIGRPMGKQEGFAYSNTFLAFDGTWDYEKLDAYLTKPSAFAPGTKMSFVGLKKVQDRADVIAYLRSLAANPAPLPVVGDAE